MRLLSSTCLLPSTTVVKFIRVQDKVQLFHRYQLRRMYKNKTNYLIASPCCSDMSKKSYWDQFYTKKQADTSSTFDWFFSHDIANQWLSKCISQERAPSQVMNILELGCGTSSLSSNLLKDVEDCRIISIDFSPSAVGQAQAISREAYTPSNYDAPIQFLVADATRLPFRNNQFDIVFEKGTFDAMLNTKNSELARRAFSETVRVLTSGGIFLQFSDENPDLRLTFLEEALRQNNVDRGQVSVTYREIGTSFGTEYFLYLTNFTNSCL